MTRVVEYRVGIDIGGTFTDLVVAGDDGTFRTMKLLSTPDDYGRGIGEGLRALMDEHAIAADAVTRIVHATTVATNAILEGKGARTALITTAGFLVVERIHFGDAQAARQRISAPAPITVTVRPSMSRVSLGMARSRPNLSSNS